METISIDQQYETISCKGLKPIHFKFVTFDDRYYATINQVESSHPHLQSAFRNLPKVFRLQADTPKIGYLIPSRSEEIRFKYSMKAHVALEDPVIIIEPTVHYASTFSILGLASLAVAYCVAVAGWVGYRKAMAKKSNTD